MAVNIGALDRRITLQSAVEARDAHGEPIQTWSEIKQVYARRTSVQGRERFSNDQRLATRVAMFRIRWLSGLNEKMRLLDSDDATIWRIVGISDDRRQGWMELSCEAIKPTDVIE
jgi:SPP1 family predicted phage head-tail adaptor